MYEFGLRMTAAFTIFDKKLNREKKLNTCLKIWGVAQLMENQPEQRLPLYSKKLYKSQGNCHILKSNDSNDTKLYLCGHFSICQTKQSDRNGFFQKDCGQIYTFY